MSSCSKWNGKCSSERIWACAKGCHYLNRFRSGSATLASSSSSPWIRLPSCMFDLWSFCISVVGCKASWDEARILSVNQYKNGRLDRHAWSFAPHPILKRLLKWIHYHVSFESDPLFLHIIYDSHTIRLFLIVSNVYWSAILHACNLCNHLIAVENKRNHFINNKDYDHVMDSLSFSIQWFS